MVELDISNNVIFRYSAHICYIAYVLYSSNERKRIQYLHAKFAFDSHH